MPYLTITVRLLDARYHGRGDGGEPEWPPSPMRLFSAIVAGNAPLSDDLAASLRWLEGRNPPTILAARKNLSNGIQTWVPSNNLNLVNGTAAIRTGKLVRPVLLTNPAVTFIWPIDIEDVARAQAVANAAGRLRCLGWGTDLAIGHGQIVDTPLSAGSTRVVYAPDELGTLELRVPTCDSLDSLGKAHQLALTRVRAKQIDDQPGVTRFHRARYRIGVPSGRRAWCAFSLRDDDGEFVGFPPNRLRHLAGMVRHAAAAAMRQADKDDAWIDEAVLGHDHGMGAGRVSILLLPTIGHAKSDGLVRRVLVQAPDADTCDLLARWMNGKQLQAQPGDDTLPMPMLELIRRPGPLLNRYVGTARTWATTTPILLPGHDVRRQDKGDHRRRIARAAQLVAKSLAQAGCHVPCEIWMERNAFWPGLTHAANYVPRQKYLKYPRWHARLTFAEPITGPLVIGAGRHVGFGVLAACDEE